MADTPLAPEDWEEQFGGLLPITNRDLALRLMEPDFEEQLIAIRGLLRRNKAADEELEAERQEIIDFLERSSGPAHEHATDEYGVKFHASIYQDAAHSMAALGMLAPLYESMFFHGFQGLRKRYFGMTVVPAAARRPISDPDGFWDCHYYYDRDKQVVNEQSLVSGTMQLAKAIGLKQHLPEGLTKILDALFAYRNYMFHNGFEWPKSKCKEFEQYIQKQGYTAWFSTATKGDEPWIFYMTEEFIQHCLALFHQLLDAFGAYANTKTPIDLYS